jgi:hypothetical protein
LRPKRATLIAMRSRGPLARASAKRFLSSGTARSNRKGRGGKHGGGARTTRDEREVAGDGMLRHRGHTGRDVPMAGEN